MIFVAKNHEPFQLIEIVGKKDDHIYIFCVCLKIIYILYVKIFIDGNDLIDKHITQTLIYHPALAILRILLNLSPFFSLVIWMLLFITCMPLYD